MTRLIWRDEGLISIKIATGGELKSRTSRGVSSDQIMGPEMHPSRIAPDCTTQGRLL